MKHSLRFFLTSVLIASLTFALVVVLLVITSRYDLIKDFNTTLSIYNIHHHFGAKLQPSQLNSNVLNQNPVEKDKYSSFDGSISNHSLITMNDFDLQFKHDLELNDRFNFDINSPAGESGSPLMALNYNLGSCIIPKNALTMWQLFFNRLYGFKYKLSKDMLNPESKTEPL